MAGIFASYPIEGGGSGGSVTSLNGLTGALTLVGTGGIVITPSGSNITIDGSGISGGANTFLSNLTSPTAINQELRPDTDQAYNFGTPSLTWAALYGQQLTGSNTATVSTAAQAISDNAGVLSINWGNRTLATPTLGSPALSWSDTAVTSFLPVLASVTATDLPVVTGIFQATTNTTVNGSNNTAAMQMVSTAIVQAGAENDKTDGVITTVARGDGTDDGLLDIMSGFSAIVQHNSGVAGTTNVSTGFDVTLLTQQGTINTHYDFRSQRVPIGGTLTNHFGLYLIHDSTTPLKNWMSGTTQMGGTSYSPADSTILDLQSTTGALLVPRMDDTARNALTATNGMIIYDTTSDELQSYMAGVWTPLGGGGSGANTFLSNLTSPTAINQDLIFNFANKSISATSQSGASGFTINITGGETTGGGIRNGGHVNITGGAANPGNLGGNVIITGGQGDGGHGGNALLRGGDSNSNAGGTASVVGGNSIGAAGGAVAITSGSADVDDNSGNLAISSPSATGVGNSGNLSLTAGAVVDGIVGNIVLTISAVSGSGSQGDIKFLKSGLPPTPGYLWTATNADGSGYWAPGTGGGAATDLSNLIATAINQDLIFNTGTAASLKTKDDSTAASQSLNIRTGNTTGGFLTGDIDIQTGASDSGNTGAVSLRSSNTAAANANSGNLSITTGSVTGAGSAGLINIQGGSTDDGTSGAVQIFSGDASGAGSSNVIAIATGGAFSGSTGPLFLSTGGNSDGANPTGDVNIITGSQGGTGGNSGSMLFQTGTVNGGTRGAITLDALYATMPVGTTNPTAPAGSLYYNTGTNKLRLFDGSTWVDLN